jgi:hypothetical protein
MGQIDLLTYFLGDLGGYVIGVETDAFTFGSCLFI